MAMEEPELNEISFQSGELPHALRHSMGIQDYQRGPNVPRTVTKKDPPRFLLDAPRASALFYTFIDIKFYVFSRRDASGRVGLLLQQSCPEHSPFFPQT